MALTTQQRSQRRREDRQRGLRNIERVRERIDALAAELRMAKGKA